MNIYDTILNDSSLRVKIILPPKIDGYPDETATPDRGKSVIVGYLENPFMVEAGAEWSDQLFGRGYSTVLNDLLGKLGSNIQAYNILDTTQQYITARIPSFNFSFYVIATNSKVNPMANVMRLYEAIYPTKVNNASIKYHWGYTPNALGDQGGNVANLSGKNPTMGTVIITIGKWFRAINMVITDVKIEYSDTLAPNGKPLWAKPSITVQPRRLPYADEFKQMFLP